MSVRSERIIELQWVVFSLCSADVPTPHLWGMLDSLAMIVQHCSNKHPLSSPHTTPSPSPVISPIPPAVTYRGPIYYYILTFPHVYLQWIHYPIVLSPPPLYTGIDERQTGRVLEGVSPPHPAPHMTCSSSFPSMIAYSTITLKVLVVKWRFKISSYLFIYFLSC